MHRAGAVARALSAVSAALGTRVDVDLPETLTGRAADRGLVRRGRVSAGGACRLLRAADGWVAVNLPRPCDAESVAAVVERPVSADVAWTALEEFASSSAAAQVAARAQLLGVPAATLASSLARRPPILATRAGPAAAAGRRPSAPLVVDLSAMWAGPLCARILGAAGMEVVKVEDVRRPDAARDGHAAFYDWLHSGHELVVVDLHSRHGVDAVRELLVRADVVIEGSRPRALAQFGIDAAATIAAARGQTWVSITAYGRSGDASNAVAFGDDAAVAGGLVAPDAAGEPVFAADALADPVTGLFAALGALASQSCGGGHLVDVAMASVSRAIARAGPEHAPHVVARHDGAWTVRCEGAFAGESATVVAPHALGTC
jgi:hypothetical protein